MVDQEYLLELTESYLKTLFADVSTNLDSNFDSSAPFGELGIDSFYVLKIVKKLEDDFGKLPKTLLFEYFNIADLAEYFVKKHHDVVVTKFQLESVDNQGPMSQRESEHQDQREPCFDVIKSEVSRNECAKVSSQSPYLIHEKDVSNHPELAPIVAKLFEQYKNESAVSRGTAFIAPNLFIGSERKGYFNYGRCKNIVLVYSFVGPEDYFPVLANELLKHCQFNQFQLNFFADEPLLEIGGLPFSATPFGVMQKVKNIKSFTLKGGSMRRLRYQVSKFEKAGQCKTVEYKCGTDPKIDNNIASIIDQWCDARAMVNPLIYIVKDEILNGCLHEQHRLFLTYLDDVLQNVILISEMSSQESGYLMDLEFYPKDMPLGGLEYAIVEIIKVLVAEDKEMLSLGGTYGCKLEEGENSDAEIDALLDELRHQDIFNDEGNLQFKNKFRPENRTIYICREVGAKDAGNVIDIIMMIADPSKMQTPDDENFGSSKAFEAPTSEPSKISQIQPPAASPKSKANIPSTVSNLSSETTSLSSRYHQDSQFTHRREPLTVIADNDRSINLAVNGFNPQIIESKSVDFDLKSDSWALLDYPAIDKQMKYLRASLQNQVQLTESLKAIFPFSYFSLTKSGRLAEDVFYQAFPKKGRTLQNLLFPTTLFNQIENGFIPTEIPNKSVFEIKSNASNKSYLDIELLIQAISKKVEDIALVCIEIQNNAAGGYPVSIEHLLDIKRLLKAHDIPIVLDATRVVENVLALKRDNKDYENRETWAIVRELLSIGDAVIVSLAKDFCVDRGGLIATNDRDLFQKLESLIENSQSSLDTIDKKLIALSLHDTKQIESQAKRRMAVVSEVWQRLKHSQIPVVEPVGGHCVLIDVKQLKPFAQLDCPVDSFLAWLFLNTGIRAGAHSVGMQRDTSLNQTVRFAFPLGMKLDEAKEIADRLVAAFSDIKNIPELMSTNEKEGVNSVFALRQYRNLLGELSTIGETSPNKIVNQIQNNATHATKHQEVSISSRENKWQPQSSELQNDQMNQSSAHSTSFDIAIIGMAGRYPKAKNMDEMWDNLINSVDCIEEIPEQRFNNRRQHHGNKRYRGGFIDDVDKFDSLFFNISPREAETMDPQERLFLEVAWETLEDAGYYPELLAEDNDTRNVGVFVGAVWAMYQSIAAEERLLGNPVISNSFLWSVANRVSYSMNFSGPSMTVDTACSSSLTAIYLACESIYKGECSSAIVGGVNLDVHPSKIEMSVAGGALSSDGVCRSFGQGANGYVAGEGIGAIFLKPLSKAIVDGDNIHGVIRSAAVNHGGRTSGYSVPNSKSQAELISSALKKANVDARTIGYIEAHGTGTELGDPIEIAGLNLAFEKDNVDLKSCAIGSVKTNIGHLEAAAGVVGVCKVLLQMKHQQLVPSLHSRELNEFIEFDQSPFYVEQNVEDWKRKTINNNEIARRAGISSFGAGGSNAHIIIEEFLSDTSITTDAFSKSSAQIIPLSARNEAQLKTYAERLKQFISLDHNKTLSIDDIAFSLQMGRKSFEHRLVVIASNVNDLCQGLTQFIDNKTSDKVFSGNTKNSDGVTRFLNKKEKEEFVNLLSQRREPSKLAELWIDGLLSDWQGFRSKLSGKRISLPSYPFADKRHWISKSDASSSSHSIKGLHPLIDTNESTFERQIFKKTFHDQEFVIYDHLVSEIPTLPGVAYLDLARKAGEAAAGKKVQKIKNILWVSPLTVENGVPTEAFIDLKPSGDSVQFEVYSDRVDGRKQLYSQGKLFFATQEDFSKEDEYIDLSLIQSRCELAIEGKDAYPLFKSLGLDLGPSFQLLQQIYKSEQEVLGVLNIPEFRKADFNEFLLHPSVIDASFQAGMAAQLAGSLDQMFVPYSLGEVEILHPLTEKCFSYVTSANDSKSSSSLSKMNVLIVDENGKVLVKVRDSIGVPLTDVHEKPSSSEKSTTHDAESELFESLYYSNYWKQTPITPSETVVNETILSKSAWLFFDHDSKIFESINLSLKAHSPAQLPILVQSGSEFKKINSRQYQINSNEPLQYQQLVKSVLVDYPSIDKVTFGWSNIDVSIEGTNEDIDLALNMSVYPFFHLCQSLLVAELKNTVDIQYIYLNDHNYPKPQDAAIVAFAKCVQFENSKFHFKSIEIVTTESTSMDVGRVALQEFAIESLTTDSIRYHNDSRFTRSIEKIDLEAASDTLDKSQYSMKQNGVYLITGGLGGLGFVFARYLAENCQAKLVLTGRSELNEEKQKQLDELNRIGAETLYLPVDVSTSADVESLIRTAKDRFGELNGVIHSAGVLRDGYVKNKSRQDLTDVFSPKILGTHNLDQATAKENLDFFVVFSSMAAIGGNIGQSDYAFANHYMDSFIEKRASMRENGQRFGKSLSLNWSIWADGGMKLDEQMTLFFKKNLGIKPLSNETGLNAFDLGINSTKHQFVVVEGLQEKLELSWGIREPSIEEKPVAAVENSTASETASTHDNPMDNNDSASVGKQDDLVLLVQEQLSQLVMDFLKIDKDDIDLDKILLDLGFDSIGLAEYSNQINDIYGTDVTPVFFFEYPSIREIAKHFAIDYKEAMVRVHKGSSTVQENQVGQSKLSNDLSQSSAEQSVSFSKKNLWGSSDVTASPVTQENSTFFSADDRFVRQPIAIVGASGVMPQSDDLDEYWEKLRKSENNMVTVIPEDRWSWEDYYGDPMTEKNKTQSKWGGFMKSVDKFDPLFWGISPREAEMMDPQQRIFLETVWKAIEDSGQKVSELAGTKTGLFVGASTRDYIDLLASNNVELDGYSASGTSHAILANRISFLLNLHGPSAPLDTACSSSLVALHRAIESIHTGSSDMAIVGGIQVMLTPAAHISFGMAGMLADDGKCKTFDERANGYVRGEGSGAIIIKPLSKAEADGNHIYAIVKATAENHGGRATMMTAPNPTAQAELLVEAYEKAQVDPTTIGFIECHGTGTSLGDPIEIQAMKKAFSELYRKHNKPAASQPHIGLTSAKTNIGHLETSAGIAGILKVILSMKHKEIPALLHYEKMNPYINLAGSPFYMVEKTQPWQPVIGNDGTVYPRRAGISSFGFGGANVHVVLEEYRTETSSTNELNDDQENVFVLSAKSNDRLKAYAQLMLEHVERKETNLNDFSYTLQTGRDEMPHRLAFVYRSFDQLKDRLKDFLAEESSNDTVFSGKVPNKKPDLGVSQESLTGWLSTNNGVELAKHWVLGLEVDWMELYKQSHPKRISLPTYPFARERYWFTPSENSTRHNQSQSLTVLADRIHPLVHQNISVLGKQSYSTRFTGKELFLNSTAEQYVISEAVLFEMMRASVEHATQNKGKASIKLFDIEWISIKPVSRQSVFEINVYGSDVSHLDIEVLLVTESHNSLENENILLCQCSAVLESKQSSRSIDLEQIRNQMDNSYLSTEMISANLELENLEQLKGINKVYRGESQLLVHVILPDKLNESLMDFGLNPGTINAVKQATQCFHLNADGSQEAKFELGSTFKVKSLQHVLPFQSEMMAWIRLSRGASFTENTVCFDIDYLDTKGNICASIKSMSYTNSVQTKSSGTQIEDFEKLLESINAPTTQSSAQSSAQSNTMQKSKQNTPLATDDVKSYSDLFESILDNIY